MSRRPFIAVLIANTISIAGSSLTLIGVPWFVLQTTGSAGRAGIVAFCATLPVAVAALVAGPVIDRLGRRRVSAVSDLICGLSVAAIPLLHYTGLLEFWMLCALMAVGGLVHTPGLTARYVLLPHLAEHAGTTVARAASLYDAVSRGARMIGAALAGLLIATIGAESVLLLDAATFGASALLVTAFLRGIPAAEPQRAAGKVSLAGYRAELAEGLRFLTRARLLLGITVMVMMTNGLDQGWSSVLLPVHGRDALGGATALGLMIALFGGFALLGALLYGAWGERFPRRAVFAAAFLLCGAPRYVVAAFTDTPLPLAVTMALSGLGAGVLNPILTTVMLEKVPDALRSRVSGVTQAGCELTMPLGGLAAGLLIDGFGVTRALLVFGGIYFLATLSPLVFPSWRSMEAAPAAPLLSRTEPIRPSSAEPAARQPHPSAK
ncbi:MULTISPECIES: MFS transporter [unclassified Streptomyces]|uniref:MFS transporter n=1 Tax=unclassified Streptomyces TaxID=2593676 RepID=UPI0020308E95|nr:MULTISPECIES: MFS transporter [unclassified Streptomyces]MCM1967547.1 MFS transporter [Streptomyces sp. G1]MCX5126031.1 MFS transporter [Streptomyces sp. NBC_00347]MCX5298170.1 MFS transporter [Streptomyces sp. NBC_00193]